MKLPHSKIRGTLKTAIIIAFIISVVFKLSKIIRNGGTESLEDPNPVDENMTQPEPDNEVTESAG
jgi:hypothetical protein